MLPTDSATFASGLKKTICTAAILKSFGVGHDEYHYWHDAITINKVLLGRGYRVESRKSALNITSSQTTIGTVRESLKDLDGDKSNRYHVGVIGHSVVLNGDGQIIVDTDPGTRDLRKVVQAYAIKWLW